MRSSYMLCSSLLREEREREREPFDGSVQKRKIQQKMLLPSVRPSVDSLFEERVGAGWDGEEDDVAV